jgi:hypothetical protein
MEYEVIEDRKFPGDWRAEAIDNDGRCYITIFSGPNAKQRAEEYARWKSER